MSTHASRSLIVVAIAIAGAYQLVQTTRVGPAPAMDTSPVATRFAASPPVATGPLLFDPPAAGPSSNPAYEACIDQPSFDGAVIDCSQLLPRPEKRRHR